MKKISLSRRNALFSPRGALATVIVGAFVLLMVGFRIFFPGVFVTIAAPAFKAGAALSGVAADIRALYIDTALLRRERDALREENLGLTNQNLALRAKVKDLTLLLGETSLAPMGVIAGVLARPPQTPYDTLLVAAGSVEGISPNMHAIALGDVPVGMVESVTAHSARVTLYSSGGNALSAWVGESRTPLTLVGAGGGAFTAVAPKTAPIAKGDIVYVAQGGAAPMGRVAEISSSPSSPTALLHIMPLINLFSLVWVKLVP